MAGSETWATYLAREFVKHGYLTTIYNDLLCEDGSGVVKDPVLDEAGNLVGDVVYRHYSTLAEDIKYEIVDYFISSRTVEPFRTNSHTIKRYVMIHDIWLSSDPKYDIMSWAVEKYAYLSDWHKDFLVQHHRMPENKMFLTSNGVCEEFYKDVGSYIKKNQAVYSSSPDRGLFQLLKMVPYIRKEVPDFELIITYGWYNWETSAKSRGDVSSLELISKIKGLIKQPGVKYLGRVGKEKLSVLQKESKIWLYPCWFSETQCITCIENGLSKNALITTNLAGLITTVGDSGIMLNPENLTRDGEYPEEFIDKFVKVSIKMLKDEEFRKEWADKAYEKMSMYSWSAIAKEWVKEFKG